MFPILRLDCLAFYKCLTLESIRGLVNDRTLGRNHFYAQ
jgi:hypothetical protein